MRNQKRRGDRRIDPHQVAISKDRPAPYRGLAQKGHEHRDHVDLDEPDEIVDDAEDGASRRWPTLTEDYLHGNLQMWVYFELGVRIAESDA